MTIMLMHSIAFTGDNVNQWLQRFKCPFDIFNILTINVQSAGAMKALVDDALLGIR